MLKETCLVNNFNNISMQAGWGTCFISFNKGGPNVTVTGGFCGLKAPQAMHEPITYPETNGFLLYDL
jgi:hypothetical protein